MSAPNPFVQLLPEINPKPSMIPAQPFGKSSQKLDKEALMLFKKAGVTAEMLQKAIQHDTRQSYDRFNIYGECARALEHWFVGPAVSLYANVATTYNPIHNATIWVTSENETYAKELNNLLNRIGVEEKIYDWAHSVASYGDLFMKLNGVPGLGIISVEDGMHPMTLSRVEYEGHLIGFYKTPQGNAQTTASTQSHQLLYPWDYTHMRLLGAKKKRPKFPGDPSHTEMRQIHLITGADTTQVSTRYGTSLILDALPAYKRLRLAEDSLLLARVTRGIIKYIWKMKVDMSNAESASSLIEQYAELITRARAIDTRAGSVSFDSKQNSLTAIEDIFVPIWGDVGDLTFEKVGGEADIRWIVDVDNLRNQLAFALACSPSLGGAFTKEASGALGSQAITELGIRFARSARRLQRSLITGIERICQIHLAFMGYDPDPQLFQVHMSETSTIEEEQIMKSLDSGMKSLQTFMKTLKGVAGRRIDMLKVWEWYNEKILKMEDFELTDFFKSPELLKKEEEARQAAMAAKAVAAEEEGGPPSPKPVHMRAEGKIFDSLSWLTDGMIISPEAIKEAKERKKKRLLKERRIFNTDILSYVPSAISSPESIEEDQKIKIKGKEILETKKPGKEGSEISDWISERDAYTWKKKFGGAKVEIGESSEESEEKNTEGNKEEKIGESLEKKSS